MKTVWIVVGSLPYEGYQPPYSVWTSKKKAEKECETLNRLDRYTDYEVIEMVISI